MKQFPTTTRILSAALLLLACIARAESSPLLQKVIYQGQEDSGTFAGMVPVIHALKPDQKTDVFSVCSGVYLAPDIVLTAAHCLPKEPNGQVIVFHQLKDGLSMASLMESEKQGSTQYAAHPNFQSQSSASDASDAISDIALIKLPEKFENAKVVSLPAKGQKLSPKWSLYLLGWGKSSYWNSEVKLRWAKVMPDLETLSQYNNLKFSHFPGTKGETICPGDSGGPSIVETKEGLVVFGVQSGSKGCGNPFGFFHSQNFITYVPAHLDWIESVIRSWRATEI